MYYINAVWETCCGWSLMKNVATRTHHKHSVSIQRTLHFLLLLFFSLPVILSTPSPLTELLRVDLPLKICMHPSNAQCCTSIFIHCSLFLENWCGFVCAHRDLSRNRLAGIPPNLFVLLEDLLQLWVLFIQIPTDT